MTTLAAVLDAAERLRDAGPFAVRVRVASDVWSVVRGRQDVDRPLLAPPPVLSVPVFVDDRLSPGEWRVEMSDGSERGPSDGDSR